MSHRDIVRGLNQAGVDVAKMEIKDRELRELRGWKESAMKTMEGIDLQAIGKQLELRLGTDVGPCILPAIKNLQAENANLRQLIQNVGRELLKRSETDLQEGALLLKEAARPR